MGRFPAATLPISHLISQRGDEAKAQAVTFMNRKPRKKPAMEKPKATKTLHLHVDIDRFKLSRILQLKALFRDTHGPEPVRIHFERAGVCINTLSISDPWGVDPSEFLTLSLEKVEGVKKVYTSAIE